MYSVELWGRSQGCCKGRELRGIHVGKERLGGKTPALDRASHRRINFNDCRFKKTRKTRSVTVGVEWPVEDGQQCRVKRHVRCRCPQLCPQPEINSSPRTDTIQRSIWRLKSVTRSRLLLASLIRRCSNIVCFFFPWTVSDTFLPGASGIAPFSDGPVD